MSRPCMSVPKGNSAPGGISAFIRLAAITGSVRAIQGAVIATTMAKATSVPPIHSEEPPFSRAAVANARIDRDIGEIDQRVDDEEEQYDQQDAALDGGDVALEHRIDQQRADARPGKQLFDHDGGAHQRAELQADGGD